jgi:hypothetical protein
MTPLSSLSVDELADGICLRAGRIAAAQAELLLWIAEFDRREGWGGVGMLSCAHWLSWRVGMSLGTARDQVRVARRLEELPELTAAFGDGRVSYSKVRAITRVADPDDGIDWVDLARHSSAAQLDKIVRGAQRAQANEEAEADPELAVWRLRTRTRYDDHGNFTMTISGPADQLPVVRAGLDAKKAELQRARDAAAAEEAAAEAARATDVVPPDYADAPPPADVSAEAPPAPAPEATGVPSAPAEDDVDLDEEVEGWPPGTTRRQVREAMDSFFAPHGEPARGAARARRRPRRRGRRRAGTRPAAGPGPADTDCGSPRCAHGRVRAGCGHRRRRAARPGAGRAGGGEEHAPRCRPAPPPAADRTRRPAVGLGAPVRRRAPAALQPAAGDEDAARPRRSPATATGHRRRPAPRRPRPHRP